MVADRLRGASLLAVAENLDVSGDAAPAALAGILREPTGSAKISGQAMMPLSPS